jgi:3'-phosphoadenosine 5'-phosphosulfate sulfotransferase
MILDSEMAMQVMVRAGTDAFAVFSILENTTGTGEIQLEDLVRWTGLQKERVRDALYRLGLLQLGVVEEPTTAGGTIGAPVRVVK